MEHLPPTPTTKPRHEFPPLHERATPAELQRLNAYLSTGRFDKAARLCGCSR